MEELQKTGIQMRPRTVKGGDLATEDTTAEGATGKAVPPTGTTGEPGILRAAEEGTDPTTGDKIAPGPITGEVAKGDSSETAVALEVRDPASIGGNKRSKRQEEGDSVGCEGVVK